MRKSLKDNLEKTMQNKTRAVLAECSVASAPFEIPDTLCLAPFVRHFRKNFIRSYHWSVSGISAESFLLFYRRTAPASADALQQNWMETFLSFLWNIPKHSFEQFLNGKLKRLKQLLRLIKKRDVLSHAKQDTGSPLWVLCCKCSLHRLFGILDKALFVLIIDKCSACFTDSALFLLLLSPQNSTRDRGRPWMEKDETFSYRS